MQPAVSIIVPTYNRLHYVQPAIASVFAQSFQHWELIIADDGSGADTRAYLRSINDPRVSVIWLPHSGRPAAVINAALRTARSEYVAFLDSDDLWLPQKLEMQLASLRLHPLRGWSYTRFVLVDGAGRALASAGSAQWPAPSGWILKPLLLEQTVIAQPSVVVSRQLLERLGAFDERLIMCYDDELWFRLAAHSEIDGIEVPLTLVRRHGQHSGSDIQAWRDRRRVFEKMLRAYRGHHLESILRRLRAQMSAGLANSQAMSGHRISAIGTVLSSAYYSWRFPQWWRGALRAFAPAIVRRAARRYRARRQPTATSTGVIS